MKISDVPFYNDPIDFESGDNKYPCSTQYMTYNPLLHKYFLTPECLTLNGIDVERKYISDAPNKMEHFINLVTKKVYDYIQYKAGWKNFQVMRYRIAICPKQIYQDPYTFRKQFEEVLILQAKWLIDNGDAAQYSAYNFEGGMQNGIKPEDEYRLNADISPEVIRALDFMGLTKWFNYQRVVYLDTSKY